MNLAHHFTAIKENSLLPIATIAVCITIFVADTLTESEIAASALYVVVVLMSVRFLKRRAVILVAVWCTVLTVLSYSITAAGIRPLGLINTAISLLTITLTTYLALKIETVKNEAAGLMEADQFREALLDSVSHELRTPLVSILGGASVLADTSVVTASPQLSSLANGIRNEAERLNSDIQNLLNATRISSHSLQSHRDWTDPVDIINSAVEHIHHRHPNRRLIQNLGEDLPLLRVDPALVEQALTQIIANAVKYSPPSSPIQINAKYEERKLVISIIDQGVGLTDSERARLPERFYRGQRHVGTIAGSGLGMWIANTFIISNGGTLQATSSGEGQGTTVQITFPTSL